MYSRNSFGSYYPINSCIHKLNPVIKLFNFILTIIILIISNSFNLHIFLMMLVFVMMLLSFVPFNYYMKTFWSLRYIYILVAFICAYFSCTMQECIVYIMKLVILVEYINLLAYTTSPSESAYGIEKFLSLFNFLYLPVSKLAFKINSILRYHPLMLSVEYKTLKASSSRGIDYYHTNIIGKTYAFSKVYGNIRRLVKNKNKEISFNSELRLYDIKKYRTNYRTNKVGFFDIILLLLHIILIYAHLTSIGGLV